MKKTLFDKVWDAHVVDTVKNGPQILYIDKHLIHEVTSPQAFEGLRIQKRKVKCGCALELHSISPYFSPLNTLCF